MTERKEGSTYPRRPRAVHTIESLMARTVEVGDCAEWTGYCAASGKVPQVKHEDKMVSVRRLILQLVGREIQPSEFAVPRCDNQLCIHPDHIRIRTGKQHARVMGRLVDSRGPGRVMKFTAYARAHKAKLTAVQATEIRLSEETSRALAERYGVNRSLVSRIKQGVAWREISSPFAGLGAR